jgi:hypothetical protein
VTAVAVRAFFAVLAKTQFGGTIFGDFELDGSYFCAFVRAITEGLFFGFTTGAPMISSFL